ncbi:MAG: hypothetical protein OZ948_02015 [Deltaproteobacteria bacterium]|nr:hypothetical protein [Deltaproteobacteria bacterium]
MEASRPLRRFAAAAASAALVSGCASLPFRLPFLGGGFERGFSQEELSDELSAYASRFSALVTTAGEEISLADDSPATRRRVLLWKLRLAPAIDDAAFQPNPRAGYVRMLTIAVMMQRYLTAGDGRNLFGASQPIAVATAETLKEDAFAIGERFLTPDELEAVGRDVDALAQRFPITGTQFSLVRAREAARAVPASNALTEVITLPLAPFRALQGVDSGAAAVRDFNQTARRFSRVVAGLPEELRGQMELLLYDVEELRSMRQGLAAFELAAASAERASLAIERLPAELRATLDQQVRGLLAESQGTIGEAAAVMAQAHEIAGPLQETATQLREASAAWREILGPHDPTPRGPGERGFDVRDWQSAAGAIGTAAVELRGLAAELEGFSAGAGLDRLFWRAAALLVLFFALLLGYRVLAARLARRG